MAAIPADNLAIFRRSYVGSNPANTLTKAQLNAAQQAVEDWFEANRAALNTAMISAIAPATMTAAQRRRVVAEWAEWKFRIGG